MLKGIFITATDTGIGKTYVASGIAAALIKLRIDVGVMKPAETGCRKKSGRLIPEDALALMKAANVRDSLSLVNPYRFSAPLAPLAAAAHEGKKINPDNILGAYYTLSRRHEFMVVEGAGGIMVPLSKNYCYLDLAEALGLPVLIVARPGLGTINHTLLTISALREKGISISGVVINYPMKQKIGLAEKTSPTIIEEFSDVRVTGTVGYGRDNFSDIASSLLSRY